MKIATYIIAVCMVCSVEMKAVFENTMDILCMQETKFK